MLHIPRLLPFILLASNAQAHMMSLSSGQATFEGTQLTYTLTMPLFEVAHISQPEQKLLEHIEFRGARAVTRECHPEPAKESYVCRATYEFPTPPDNLEVNCTFTQVTVPNHVHLLRATNGSKHDSAVFDSAFTTAILRFRPPTPTELAARQIANGAAQVFIQILPLLFLVTLSLAAPSFPQLATLTLLFFAGQLAGALIPWQPNPRFLECAAALAVAYLAVEVLFLPYSKVRWLLAIAVGLVPGLSLASFVRESESGLPYTFLGTAIAGLVILGIAGTINIRFPKFRRPAAALSLATSAVWFVLVLSR